MTNIVLCGMMGSGKSTVSEAIERLYGLKRVDTDEVIVSRYGGINKIFSEKGEECFRDIESSVIKSICESAESMVVSLGGGAVLRESNVKILKSAGKIFYLRARPETLIARLQGDDMRPLLRGDLSSKINSLLGVRAPIYEKAADIVVDTDGLSPEAIAKIIMEHLK